MSIAGHLLDGAADGVANGEVGEVGSAWRAYP